MLYSIIKICDTHIQKWFSRCSILFIPTLKIWGGIHWIAEGLRPTSGLIPYPVELSCLHCSGLSPEILISDAEWTTWIHTNISAEGTLLWILSCKMVPKLFVKYCSRFCYLKKPEYSQNWNFKISCFNDRTSSWPGNSTSWAKCGELFIKLGCERICMCVMPRWVRGQVSRYW